MYRVTVLSDGKHHNTVLGPHYCFTRKEAKNLVKIFLKSECDVSVHKFICIKCHFFFWQNSFCWSDAYEEVGFDVEEIYDEIYGEEEQNEGVR